MNVTNPPPSEVATAFHVRNAIRSRLARRELAEFLVEKKEGGPMVMGIYIHPGERVMIFSIIYEKKI